MPQCEAFEGVLYLGVKLELVSNWYPLVHVTQGRSFSVHPAKKWNITFVLVSSSISDQKDPRDRMVQVVKWYLSAFHAGRRGSVAKKPYNPILGEIFQCHWTLPNDTEENAVSPLTLSISLSLCVCLSVCVSLSL